MTVLVGIACDGGVVVGADSSATFAAGHARTIEQTTKKLTIVDDQMIIATTGAAGLGQRFVAVVEQLRKEKKLMGTPIEIGKAISHAAIADFTCTMPHINHALANSQLGFGGLVAFVHKKRAHLVEFDATTLQPELKDDRMWYVSMGSGQLIADPFLGMMRRCFFQHGPPDVPTGRFVVSWTLQHTCDVNPGGVKEPFNVAVLETATSKARELSEQELLEHVEMIQQAYGHLAAFPDAVFSEESPPIPG